MNKTFKKVLKYTLAAPFVLLAGWVAVILLYGALLVGAGLVGMVYEYFFGSENDRKVATHLTIYVQPELQRQGGVMLVAGVPVSDEKWKAIIAAGGSTNHLAMLDPANPKAKKVKPGDRHVGVVVSSAASAVEMYYPASGTYTYNFLTLPNTQPAPVNSGAALLQTKVISSGSFGSILDLETGGRIDWPSASTLLIAGEKFDETWARKAVSIFYDRDEKESGAYPFKITRFPGVRLFEANSVGIDKHVSTVR